MNPLNVSVKLKDVHCFDEGDGPGSAEPYLWTVFFKIDGDTAKVNSALKLEGTATVVGSPGNHGNLPNHDVDEGETVAIPAAIGEFNTTLKPIPLETPILGKDSVGGAIGCIAVLMEEDGTPNSAVAKGHNALNSAVQSELNRLISTLGVTQQEPSDQDIKDIEAKVGNAVENAIREDVSVWDWLGAFGNMDDKIGSVVFKFSHSQLENGGSSGLELKKRWKSEGDWELRGRIQASKGSSWSGWEDLGGILTSAPAVASWSANRLDCFVRGQDMAMWHKWWDGNQWSGWEDLGGVITSAPAAVSWGTNRIDCFAKGRDRAMWHKWWDGSSWKGWENLGGVLTSAPAVSSWSANRLDCFVRGQDSHLWHKWWDGNRWSGWEDLGGELKSAPAAVSWGANRIDVFVRGMDDAMWHKWWDGNQWRGWESLGGVLTSAPAVSSWSANRLDCFVKGGDDSLWHKWWDGNQWSHWEGLGGTFISHPAAVSWGSKRIDVFVRGMNQHMWHKWYR